MSLPGPLTPNVSFLSCWEAGIQEHNLETSRRWGQEDLLVESLLWSNRERKGSRDQGRGCREPLKMLVRKEAKEKGAMLVTARGGCVCVKEAEDDLRDSQVDTRVWTAYSSQTH